MDSCSPHITSAIIHLPSTARVRVVAFAQQPQTTQLIRVLDLTLSGILKIRGQSQLPREDDARSAPFIRKVYHDFRMTMTVIESNIWGAFRGIRVKYSVVHGVQRVSLDEISLRESEAFKMLWDMNFPLGNLSPRRRSCKFGSINEPD
jgi:hypothetical protein